MRVLRNTGVLPALLLVSLASPMLALGPEDVDKAMNRHLNPDVFGWAQKRLGVDVARFGDDRTVLFPRQGLASFRPQVLRKQRTTDIAAMVAQQAFGALKGPIMQVTPPHTPVPFSPALEDLYVPGPEQVVAAVQHVMQPEAAGAK